MNAPASKSLPPSPYLLDPYAPVGTESDPIALSGSGELPDELLGTYARNGPNPAFAPQGRYHWFDGDGMVHAVVIDDAGARYVRRYVRTDGLAEEERAGGALWTGLMNRFDPSSTDERGQPRPPNKDTANTDLLAFRGRFLATWWLGGRALELDPATLETLGGCPWSDRMPRMAAHPKLDPKTGELVFFNFSVDREPFLSVGIAAPDGTLSHATDVPLSSPRLLHDLAITENYIVLLDMPLVWDRALYAQGKRRVQFHRDMPMRIGVLRRGAEGSTTQWFSFDPCYIFHTINAYETKTDTGTEIVLYACRVADPVPQTMTPDPSGPPRLEFIELTPHLHRFRLDLASGLGKLSQLDDLASEFPRVNEHRLGDPSLRYSYHGRLAPLSTLRFDAIVKYDLVSGARTVHAAGDGAYFDEPSYVARPGATAEDDGWLVTFRHDLGADRSELVVLDASDLTRPPLAMRSLPERIPIGFHSAFASV